MTIHEFGEAENNSPGTSTRLATALRYGEAGLPIVPLHGTKNGRCTCGDENCERRGRHPRAEEGRVPYATTDATIIRKYCTDWPNAAIAVETGKWHAPNIIAVMITREDVNAPQTDRWGPARPPEWVKMEGEAESHTVMFRRGKRDVCLFRAGPGGVLDGKLQLTEGVTIFGKGEYVRLPGSFDAEDEHRFEPGCAVGEVDLAPVPKWLAGDIRRARGDHSDETSTLPTWFEHTYVAFDSIGVPAYVHDAEKSKLIAESIKVTGLRKPLTVRQLTDCSFALLSDPHQLEALESLGIEYCQAVAKRRHRSRQKSDRGADRGRHPSAQAD